MGFHICEYCEAEGAKIDRNNTSSGDVTLIFSSGSSYQVPDMITHYIAHHNWLPPVDFIYDVCDMELVNGLGDQTKEQRSVKRIGYLSGPFQIGDVPVWFVSKLEGLMKRAADLGDRMQFRGG